MKCMTVKEIDELLEQMSKNINFDDDKKNTKTNEELDKSLNECLKEINKLSEKKSNKEEYVEDENLCSFSSKEINKLSEETEKLLQGKENSIEPIKENIFDTID